MIIHASRESRVSSLQDHDATICDQCGFRNGSASEMVCQSQKSATRFLEGAVGFSEHVHRKWVSCEVISQDVLKRFRQDGL